MLRVELGCGERAGMGVGKWGERGGWWGAIRAGVVCEGGQAVGGVQVRGALGTLVRTCVPYVCPEHMLHMEACGDGTMQGIVGLSPSLSCLALPSTLRTWRATRPR